MRQQGPRQPRNQPKGDRESDIETPSVDEGVYFRGVKASESHIFAVTEEVRRLQLNGCDQRKERSKKEPQNSRREEKHHGKPQRQIDRTHLKAKIALGRSSRSVGRCRTKGRSHRQIKLKKEAKDLAANAGASKACP